MNTLTTARITSRSETTNPKFTAHISSRCDEAPKNPLKSIADNARDVVTGSRATSEIRSLTSMLPHSQCTCALDCGARVEDYGAFSPERPPQAMARCP